jgi:hypothetical protein
MVDVAVMVSVAAVSAASTLKTPLALIDDLLPLTVHVTVCAGLFVPSTIALNDTVLPFCTLVTDAVTVTPVTVTSSSCSVGSAGVTVTVAVLYLDVSVTDVALTVNDVAVSVAATLKTPPVFIAVPVPPPVTVHVTFCDGVFVPSTVAVNVVVPPA